MVEPIEAYVKYKPLSLTDHFDIFVKDYIVTKKVLEDVIELPKGYVVHNLTIEFEKEIDYFEIWHCGMQLFNARFNSPIKHFSFFHKRYIASYISDSHICFTYNSRIKCKITVDLLEPIITDDVFKLFLRKMYFYDDVYKLLIRDRFVGPISEEFKLQALFFPKELCGEIEIQSFTSENLILAEFWFQTRLALLRFKRDHPDDIQHNTIQHNGVFVIITPGYIDTCINKYGGLFVSQCKFSDKVFNIDKYRSDVDMCRKSFINLLKKIEQRTERKILIGVETFCN